MTNKTIKFLISSLCTILALFICIHTNAVELETKSEEQQSVKAAHTLQFWCSNATEIAYWRSIPSDINSCYLDGNTLFDTGMQTAVTNWRNALGCTLNYNPVNKNFTTNGGIIIYGGSYGEIYDTGDFTSTEVYGTDEYGYLKSGYVQLSRVQDGVSYITSSGITVTGSYITKARGFVADKGTGSNYTNQYKKTCTHELGHALGWLGHSSNSSDIMYGLSTSVTALTNRDINHLLQIYNIW